MKFLFSGGGRGRSRQRPTVTKPAPCPLDPGQGSTGEHRPDAEIPEDHGRDQQRHQHHQPDRQHRAGEQETAFLGDAHHHRHTGVEQIDRVGERRQADQHVEPQQGIEQHDTDQKQRGRRIGREHDALAERLFGTVGLAHPVDQRTDRDHRHQHGEIKQDGNLQRALLGELVHFTPAGNVPANLGGAEVAGERRDRGQQQHVRAIAAGNGAALLAYGLPFVFRMGEQTPDVIEQHATTP